MLASVWAIYGYNHTYDELLVKAQLTTLKERREAAFEKFARKAVKNPKYNHWFPLKENLRQTRHSNLYKEEKAVGNRLFNSPIFAMRRLLNGNKVQEEVDLTGLFNAP